LIEADEEGELAVALEDGRGLDRAAVAAGQRMRGASARMSLPVSGLSSLSLTPDQKEPKAR
jgi:hypothetical protein